MAKPTSKSSSSASAAKPVAAGSSSSKPTDPKSAHLHTAVEEPHVDYSAKQFYVEDYGRTLFPLITNKILVEHGEHKIREYINNLVAMKQAFLPQRRVYAAKDALHMRRTVKLDPVAEFFIYDLIYRNRHLFRKPHSKFRLHFGYRFEDGKPVPGSTSYKEFKLNIWTHNLLSMHFVAFDVSSYFNHVYHHDLVE